MLIQTMVGFALLLSLSTSMMGFIENNMRVQTSWAKKSDIQPQIEMAKFRLSQDGFCNTTSLFGLNGIPDKKTGLSNWSLTDSGGNPLIDLPSATIDYSLTIEKGCDPGIVCPVLGILEAEIGFSNSVGAPKVTKQLALNLSVQGASPGSVQKIVGCSTDLTSIEEDVIVEKLDLTVAITFVDCSGSSEQCKGRVVHNAMDTTNIFPGDRDWKVDGGGSISEADCRKKLKEHATASIDTVVDDPGLIDWAQKKYNRTPIQVIPISFTNLDTTIFKPNCGFKDVSWSVYMVMAK